jgi:hypothetical protein
MALTRANAETVVVSRVGGLMEFVELTVTYAGSNSDLDEPLAWAARRMGISLSDPTTVTDSELSGLSGDDIDDYLDLAEYRALEKIQGNLDLVDVTAGPRSEKLSQIANQVEKMLSARRDRVLAISETPAYRYIELDMVAQDSS